MKQTGFRSPADPPQTSALTSAENENRPQPAAPPVLPSAQLRNTSSQSISNSGSLAQPLPVLNANSLPPSLNSAPLRLPAMPQPQAFFQPRPVPGRLQPVLPQLQAGSSPMVPPGFAPGFQNPLLYPPAMLNVNPALFQQVMKPFQGITHLPNQQVPFPLQYLPSVMQSQVLQQPQTQLSTSQPRAQPNTAPVARDGANAATPTATAAIEDSRWVCPVSDCAKLLPSSLALKKHIAHHDPAKAFVCSVCKLRFREKAGLRRHMRTHTGEKPYKCTFPGCGKTFADVSNVKRHELAHVGFRPFKCNQPGCERTFTRRGPLRNHMSSAHGIDFKAPGAQLALKRHGAVPSRDEILSMAIPNPIPEVDRSQKRVGSEESTPISAVPTPSTASNEGRSTPSPAPTRITEKDSSETPSSAP